MVESVPSTKRERRQGTLETDPVAVAGVWGAEGTGVQRGRPRHRFPRERPPGTQTRGVVTEGGVPSEQRNPVQLELAWPGGGEEGHGQTCS